MELLYLWIEEYGQISRQGFEFSPEFRFSLSEDAKTLRIKWEPSEPFCQVVTLPWVVFFPSGFWPAVQEPWLASAARYRRSFPACVRQRHRSRRGGWHISGLPHYMGAGRYTWNATFTAEELARPWSIRFDRIVDSAELYVNGLSYGSQAWAPWEWQLAGLRAGRNRFELIVHGTAGNKHELDWPNQPQGWIGSAVLLSRTDAAIPPIGLPQAEPGFGPESRASYR